MRKCIILLPLMCRSTEALTKPIKERLEKEEWCTVDTIQVFAGQYTSTLNQMEDYFISRDKPDLVFLVGDRIEAGAIAQSAFLNGVHICHYGSGITNYPISCYDDLVRHQISLVSDILLCEDYISFCRTTDLFSHLRIDKEDIHIVGNLYLEEIDNISEELVPKEPYDLVLINDETLNPKFSEFIITDIELDKLVIFIDSNPDKEIDYNNIHFKCSKKAIPITNMKVYSYLTRPEYLGLVKHCSRYIGNSSSIYYELPYYLKPENIIHVGSRNCNRSTNFNEMQKYPNTANRIIEILREWWSKQCE